MIVGLENQQTNKTVYLGFDGFSIARFRNKERKQHQPGHNDNLTRKREIKN